MESNNRYTKMQEAFYSKGTSNHQEHDSNPDYWSILLKGIGGMSGLALDFGCGKGRNVTNMIKKGNFDRVDGVDISQNNIDFCEANLTESKFYKNNGVDLSQIESDTYDFVMSTIVLQHIPVYDIRLSIMEEIHRVLKKGGVFNFQMGYGDDLINQNGNDRISYYSNYYEAEGTNGVLDVRVTDKQDIINDLTNIGFTVNNISIKDSFSDYGHPKWIYVNCFK